MPLAETKAFEHPGGFMRRTCWLIAAALVAGTSSLLAAEGRYVDTQTVRQAQQVLNKHGHRIAADGIMGPRTQKALREFQKSENLEPTGRLNRQTLVALGLQAPDAATQAQAPRYDRETIRKAQSTLNHRGYHAGEANGVMTEQTRAALREFQKSENLDATGQLNPGTVAALGIDAEPTASAGASTSRR
jgi:peptidoglycan hydrolase-like protein with peptidoglycan-binding domain